MAAMPLKGPTAVPLKGPTAVPLKGPTAVPLKGLTAAPLKGQTAGCAAQSAPSEFPTELFSSSTLATIPLVATIWAHTSSAESTRGIAVRHKGHKHNKLVARTPRGWFLPKHFQ